MKCEECGGETKHGECVDPSCYSQRFSGQPKYDLAAGTLLIVTDSGTLRMATTKDLLESKIVKELFEICNVCGYARKWHDNGLFPGEVFIEGEGMVACDEIKRRLG